MIILNRLMALKLIDRWYYQTEIQQRNKKIIANKI